MKMTLQQAAQAALDAQDACNLSGVVHSLADVTETVWDEARRLGKGTDFVNTHSIVTLFLNKLTSLNRSDCFCSEAINSYTRATNEVEKIARGEVGVADGH